MPDISIIKLKVRRGTDAQRRTIILEQGELGYTTDTNRLYVGDGSTVGGGPVGAVMLKPLTTAVSLTGITGAALYDIVSVSSLLYQLTGSNYTSLSSWAFIGTKVDNSALQYNGSNALTIKNNGITGTKFASTAAFNQGAIIATATNGLSTNIDNTTVKITTNRLTVGTISAGNISNKALGKGLRGGDGTTLSINATPSSFGYNNSGVLALTALPFGIVNAASLSANTIGPGLFIDTNNKLEATFQTVDASLTLNSNQLSITPVVAGATTTFSNITYNNNGQITSTRSAVATTLTGRSGNNSAANTYLSAFNGFPSQTRFTNQSLSSAVSANSTGSTTIGLILTSAGFMSINTTDYGRVAIPIFKHN
jgi:hypothetical protein